MANPLGLGHFLFLQKVGTVSVRAAAFGRVPSARSRWKWPVWLAEPSTQSIFEGEDKAIPLVLKSPWRSWVFDCTKHNGPYKAQWFPCFDTRLGMPLDLHHDRILVLQHRMVGRRERLLSIFKHHSTKNRVEYEQTLRPYRVSQAFSAKIAETFRKKSKTNMTFRLFDFLILPELFSKSCVFQLFYFAWTFLNKFLFFWLFDFLTFRFCLNFSQQVLFFDFSILPELFSKSFVFRLL